MDIVCKGSSLPDADEIHRYRDKGSLDWQYGNFCCGVYDRCPGYRTIKHWKWDAEDEEQ